MPPPFPLRDVRAVAAALAPRGSPRKEAWRACRPEGLLAVARHWQVTAPLWRSLRDEAGLEAQLAAALREDFWSNVRVNAHWVRALTELCGRLNQEGVEPLLLKGACQLVDPPSGHAGTRYLVDLDVLVPPGRDADCQQALCGLGFAPAPMWDSPEHHHWPKLSRRAGEVLPPVVVEIHRFPRLGGDVVETEDFFTHSIPWRLAGGVRCRLPSTLHRLLLNAMHAVSPHEGELHWAVVRAERTDAVEQVNLRQLLDFAELAALRSDTFTWPALLATADRYRARWDVQQWAHLAGDLLGVPLPHGVAPWYTGRPEWRTPYQLACRAARAGLRACGLLRTVRRMRQARSARSPAKP
jgi:hypothetical protein